MLIGLLGTVEVSEISDGAGGGPGTRVSALGGLMLRGLLARLALDAGRTVPTPVLVDGLWGATPPDGTTNALQALVSRLRRTVGAELVTTAARGYRLELPAGAVDALRFGELVAAAGAAGDPVAAHTMLGQAISLWRGPALADVQDLPFAGPAAHRLDERRAGAVEERARLALQLGDPSAEIDALSAQLDAAPLRESTAVLLASALHALGRQADALDVLDRTRGRLVEELGVDPGPELAEARLAVLRGSPAPVRPKVRPVSAAPALNSFVGRERDVRRVRDLLGTARLVTLTGPGGAGKTRLAREAVNGEARVAELAALTAAEQVPAAVLGAVGEPDLLVRAQEEPPPDTTARLLTVLGGRRLVLVLDNCEHLVDGVAVLAETLLHACPQLRVLATSREPLGVPGEVLHPVESLPEADAVRLFTERAAAVRPGFTPTGGDAVAVTEICRRLDGQPLPIELAAARMRTLSPAEIAARLDDRFRLLTTGPRTALPRHQTLRAVVDWSWDLLTEAERTVMSRLAAFAGGATAAAAEHVCSVPGGPCPDEVFELLASLVDKSLVVAVPQPDGADTRYRMLETIREYAGERLDESGGRASAEAAHTAVVLELAETAEPHLRGVDQLHWLARLRAEADEIDIALRRATTARDAATAHRLVAAMAWSWVIRGLMDDIGRWLDLVYELDGPVPAPARLVNHTASVLIRLGRGDMEGMQRSLDEALALAADLPPPLPPVAELLGPVHALFVKNDQTAVVQLVISSADPWVRGIAAQTLASRAENDGELDEQRRYLRVAHEEFTRIGDRFGLGMVLHSLGELEDIAGDFDAAARAYDESITLATELGNDDDLPQFVGRRAALSARRGDLDGARAELRRALAVVRPPASSTWVLHTTLADVERLAGNVEAARAELAAAAADLVSPGLGRPQRHALLASMRAAIELAAGDVAAARELIATAAPAMVEARDGPITAAVAGTAAALLLAEGDPEAAALLLGVAARQRGTPDRGSPDVAATYAGTRSTLGPKATDEAIRRGRDLTRDEGMDALVERIAPARTHLRASAQKS